MDKTQKMILILIILVIIIIGIIATILILPQYKRKPEEYGYYYVEEAEPQNKIELVTFRNNYYIVKDCVSKYYLYNIIASDPAGYYADIQEDEIEEVRDETLEMIYNMLDKEYIESNGITTSNIDRNIETINQSTIDITSMYINEKTTNISIYIVEGTLRDKKNNNLTPFKMIVKIDLANETFSIIPNDYVEKNYNNLSIGDTLNIEVSENIKINANNKYRFRSISDEEYVKNLFGQYKEEIQYNREGVYNKLDKEYKLAKFSTISEFNQYIQNRNKDLSKIQLSAYSKVKRDNYTEYIITDSEGNYYILKETAVMQYTLILDTYTIDIPEFTEKYEGSTPQEKVILNINKFMLAINNKDYKYAYSILAESFKANNFKTYEEFEKYAKINFFEENKFDYEEFGDEANTYYTYKVKITDNLQDSSSEITKTFIVLLEDGTDFKLSFNI